MERPNNLHFTTLNVDEQEREWFMTIEELEDEFYNGECDLPSLDDFVLGCTLNGTPLRFHTFSELMRVVVGEP